MPDRLTIRDVGELALLDAIQKQLVRNGVPAPPSLVMGPGDDAAILSPPAGRDLVWTCDTQVAGRHFLPDVFSAEEIGYRAMQVCLSDLAAMGAWPLAALVSLGLPADMLVADVLAFHTGIAAALDSFSAVVAGGNVVHMNGPFYLDLSVLGTVPAGRSLRRAGAHPGDVIFITGAPGASAAGLAWIQDRLGGRTQERPDLAAQTSMGVLQESRDELLSQEPWAKPLVAAYVSPRARIEAGQRLLEESLATSAIDISDGWGGDLLQLCKSSGTRARLRLADFPRAALLPAAQALRVDPSLWQLGPSDDYELLFTAEPSHVDRIRELATFGLDATPVGRIEAGKPEILIEDAPSAHGWDHFGPTTEP